MAELLSDSIGDVREYLRQRDRGLGKKPEASRVDP